MHFRQFHLGCLAHAPYLIGSGSETAVVDPQRDIAWHMANLPLASVEQISIEELRQRIEESSVDIILDVRRPKEWETGHIPQATSMPLNHLSETALSLNRDAKIAAVCAGGYRSSIATSLLEQLGFRNISNVVGGMTAWNNAKFALAS